MVKDIIQVSLAASAAVIFSLVYSLVFAGIVTFSGMGPLAIKIVNQVAKIAAIVFGGLLFVRGERGLLKGVSLGVSAVIQTWMLFSVISGGFALGWGVVLETLIGAFAGGITGVIAVNVKKA